MDRLIHTHLKAGNMKFRMTNFSKNVRVDLSDREVHVPKKEKFRIVREPAEIAGEPWNSESNITVFFGLGAVISLIFMIIAIIGMNNEWQSLGIWCLITFLMCCATLIASFAKYGFKWQSYIWVFNSILWLLNTISHM